MATVRITWTRMCARICNFFYPNESSPLDDSLPHLFLVCVFFLSFFLLLSLVLFFVALFLSLSFVLSFALSFFCSLSFFLLKGESGLKEGGNRQEERGGGREEALLWDQAAG